MLFRSRDSNWQKQPEYVKTLGNSHKEGKKGRPWGLFAIISVVECYVAPQIMNPNTVIKVLLKNKELTSYY